MLLNIEYFTFFRNDTLEDMIPMIHEGVRSCLADWVDRKDICVYPECSLMAFLIAASALVGLDVKASRESGMDKTFHNFINNLMTLPYDIPGFGFHKVIHVVELTS